MTQTEKIKEFLNSKMSSFAGVNEALKAYNKESSEPATYAAFRRVYLMYEDGVCNHVSRTEGGYENEIEIKKSAKGTPYPAWRKIEVSEKPTPLHKGHAVLLCGFDAPIKGTIQKYHNQGDPQWPDSDGFTVVENGTNKTRYVTKESIKLTK